MIRPGTLPFRGTRTNPLVYRVLFRGLNLTGAAMAGTIRQGFDNPVDTISLPTAAAGTTGVRLVGAPVQVDGVWQSVIEIFVTEADMAEIPDAPELGDDVVWKWWLNITPSGGIKQRYLEGSVYVGGPGAGRGSGSGDMYDAIAVVDEVATTVIMGSGAMSEAVLEEIAAAGAAAFTEQLALAQAAADAVITTGGNAVAKTADTSVTSSTTLVTDSELSIPVTGGALINFRGSLVYTAGSAGDFKYRITGPASPASITIKRRTIAPGGTEAVAVDTAFSTSDIVVDGGTGTGVIAFEGVLKNGSTAGTIGIQWAQNTSNATATVLKAGSLIEYTRVPSPALYAFADSAIAMYGVVTGGPLDGRNAVTPYGDGAYIDTNLTGTKIEARVHAGTYYYTIDGGSVQTVTAPAGWSYITLGSVLTSDAKRRVRIKGTWFDDTETFRVSGTNPAIERPVGNIYPINIGPNAAYIAKDGVSTLQPYGGIAGAAPYWMGAGGALRFKAQTTSISLFMYPTSLRWAVYRDGVLVADSTPALQVLFGGNGVRVTLATGLNPASAEYELVPVSPVDAVIQISFLEVDYLETIAHAAKELDVWYGDSIVDLLGITDVRDGHAWKLARATGRTAIRRGKSGALVSAGGTLPNYLRDNTSNVTGLASAPKAPTRVFATGGTNDFEFGSASFATFQADYQTMDSNIRAGLPVPKIYCLGMLDRADAVSGAGATRRNSINTRVAAAVTALADSNIVYVNTDGWIIPTTGVDLQDNVHLLPSGYTKVATMMEAAL